MAHKPSGVLRREGWLRYIRILEHRKGEGKKVPHTIRDELIGETVCTIPFDRTVKVYPGKYDEKPFFEKIGVLDGDVMYDTRWEGSFQK